MNPRTERVLFEIPMLQESQLDVFRSQIVQFAKCSKNIDELISFIKISVTKDFREKLNIDARGVISYLHLLGCFLDFIKDLDKGDLLYKKTQAMMLIYMEFFLDHLNKNAFIKIELSYCLELFPQIIVQFIEHIVIDEKSKNEFENIFKRQNGLIKHGLLVEACKQKHDELVKFLITIDAPILASVSSKSKQGNGGYYYQEESALDFAGDKVIDLLVVTLLKSKRFNSGNIPFKYLILVCKKGNLEIIKSLRERRVTFNRINGESSNLIAIWDRSPLLAALAYHPEIVEKLDVKLKKKEIDLFCLFYVNLLHTKDDFFFFYSFYSNLRDYISNSDLKEKKAYITRIDEKMSLVLQYLDKYNFFAFCHRISGNDSNETSIGNVDINMLDEVLAFGGGGSNGLNNIPELDDREVIERLDDVPAFGGGRSIELDSTPELGDGDVIEISLSLCDDHANNKKRNLTSSNESDEKEEISREASPSSKRARHYFFDLPPEQDKPNAKEKEETEINEEAFFEKFLGENDDVDASELTWFSKGL